MADNTGISPWGVADDDVLPLIPEEGWLADYLSLMADCTDAPLIFHLGTAATVLAACAANTDFVVQHKDGRVYMTPCQLWSCIVAPSGDRKSNAMAAGVRLFTRARDTSNDPDGLLPSDGSLEAWHDFMAENSNNVLLYRDEMAYLFDQSRRGYSESTKSWLMTLYGGERHTRVIRPRQGDGRDVRRITIERPRLSILGGIPPDTFKSKTNKGDWKSGFLARMVFWPGRRQRYQELPVTDRTGEMHLAKWLNRVAVQSKGHILIPHQAAQVITGWIRREVEEQRQEMPEEVFSHLIRYQDLGFRLACLYALSRCVKPQGSGGRALKVSTVDTELAVATLNVLREAAGALYTLFRVSGDGEHENEVLALLKKRSPAPMTARDISEALPQYSMARIRNICEELHKSGAIQAGQYRTQKGARGRVPMAYKYT